MCHSTFQLTLKGRTSIYGELKTQNKLMGAKTFLKASFLVLALIHDALECNVT